MYGFVGNNSIDRLDPVGLLEEISIGVVNPAAIDAHGAVDPRSVGADGEPLEIYSYKDMMDKIEGRCKGKCMKTLSILAHGSDGESGGFRIFRMKKENASKPEVDKILVGNPTPGMGMGESMYFDNMEALPWCKKCQINLMGCSSMGSNMKFAQRLAQKTKCYVLGVRNGENARTYTPARKVPIDPDGWYLVKPGPNEFKVLPATVAWWNNTKGEGKDIRGTENITRVYPGGTKYDRIAVTRRNNHGKSGELDFA